MYEYLSDCREIEDLASKIYLELAAHNNLSVDLRKVFQKLSSDEGRHARNIDLVLQASLKEMEPMPRVSWEKIQSVKNLAGDFFVQASGTELNEEKALRMAVQMEQEFIKVHVQNSLYLNNLPLMSLFETLNAEDQSHIELLNQCLKQRRKSSG